MPSPASLAIILSLVKRDVQRRSNIPYFALTNANIYQHFPFYIELAEIC